MAYNHRDDDHPAYGELLQRLMVMQVVESGIAGWLAIFGNNSVRGRLQVEAINNLYDFVEWLDESMNHGRVRF